MPLRHPVRIEAIVYENTPEGEGTYQAEQRVARAMRAKFGKRIGSLRVSNGYDSEAGGIPVLRE